MKLVVVTLTLFIVFTTSSQAQTVQRKPATDIEATIDEANRRLLTNSEELTEMIVAEPGGSLREMELKSYFLQNCIVNMSLEQLSTLMALSRRAEKMREPETRKTVIAYMAMQYKLMDGRLQEVMDSANQVIARSPDNATLASLRDLRDIASLVRDAWMRQAANELQEAQNKDRKSR